MLIASHHTSPSCSSSTALYIGNYFRKGVNKPGQEDDAGTELDQQEKEERKRSGSLGSSIDSFIPLPVQDVKSYANAVKANVLSGEFGERGEQYVIAQFGLLLCITIGAIPYFGDIVTLALGPALIGASLVIVYKAAADLGKKLSPWPVPADQTNGDGGGSLVDTGIYSYVRHPMYSGLVFGMAGLSMVTDSAMRLLLTVALYYVLDVKADFEEAKLIEAYGDEYVDYMCKVQGKLIPNVAISWGKRGEVEEAD